MTQTIQLVLQKDNVNLTSQVLSSKQPIKVTAEEGMRIALSDAKTGQTAKKLKAKKVADDLLIANEDGETLLTIEDYYLTSNIELGTVSNSGFVEFEYGVSETGATSQIASETSYTTLVSDILSGTSIVNGVSNGVLLGSLGAVGIGIAAIGSGSSDDSPKVPANKLPVSKNTTITATEDTVVTGKLAAATDADGDVLSYAIAATAANGKVIIGKDGSYSYIPNANFNGSDSFTYTITDGKGGTITQTATVNVAAVNDAPVSANSVIAATEDTIAKGMLVKATDVDGDTLTYTLATAAANGKVTIGKDGSYSYTPNANFNGSDSFTYTVSDGTETITKTANVTVASVNDVPVSKNTTITATEDTVVTGKLAAATDADGDVLSYAIAATAANGKVIIGKDGSYSYIPNANFNGSDSFTYTVSDGKGGTITQTATVNVAAVNDVPVSANSVIAATEDTIAKGMLVKATDVDGDTLTYTLATAAANGKVTIGKDGSYSYTPNANFNGSDSFTYTVSDGTETITKTANVTVASVNDVPVSKNTTITATEDTVVTGKLAAATDADGDVLSYAIAATAANGKVIIGKDGSYSYIPNANFNGSDSFTYTITDGKGGTITQTATVNVAAVNDAPVSANSVIAATEDTIAKGMLVKATDVDGDTLTYTLATTAANGKVSIGKDGSYSYTPNANFNGSDSFTYTVSDGTETITKTANVTVASVNDVPVSKDTTIAATEDTVVTGKLAAATDTDGDALSYAIATTAANGKVTIGKDGSYSYTPNANFNGSDSFTYTINDGKGGVITQTTTISVAAVNDAPVSTDSTIAATEDTVAEGQLATATDVDGDTLTYALASETANGSVIVNADGSYSYTPNANFNGSDSFTYTVSDGTETITKTANVTVASVNDVPVSKDTTIAATEDTVVTGQLESATDADSDTLTYAIKDTAANGTATVNADGSYSYTPNADFNGSDTFTYTINDGKGGVITQTATVNVAAVNDAPVSANSVIAATEDTIAKGMLVKATDVDGDTLTYTLATAAANGKVTIGKDGSYSYTPNANFNGSDSFTYTVSDGTETITKTANVTVASVNDVPVSKDTTIAATEDTVVTGQLESATDADSDTLTYAIKDTAANGTATVNADGSYSYTPNADFNGSDTFTYTINDGKGGVITQTATVNVAAVNDAPVSANSVIAATEDTIAKGMLVKATDVDGDALTYTLATTAANGKVTIGKDGSYSYTPNANFNGSDSFTYTVSDGTETITKTANVTVNSFSEVYNRELQETFETTVVSEPQTVVNKQASSFISETITFEITGQNAMPQLELTNGSDVIQGDYYYNLQGSGISASGSSSFSSVGSSTSSIDLGIGTLPPGIYTLDLYVNSSGSSINFNVTEFKDVEKIEFTGYQSVTGNIFADDDGGINAPNGYELQIDGQSLIFQAGSSASSPIIIDTENGQLELSADGSYVYRSNGNELGLNPTQLAEKFDIKVVDLQGGYVGAYRVNISSDTTPPESGELVFNNFEDTGLSQDDGITQDNTFDLTIENNEVGSQVEYQYSTDQGVTWQVLADGTVSNLADGDYSFRAKVTDEALNESFTAVKDITIDATAPILGQILNFNTANNQLEVNADIDQDTLQAFKSENGVLVPIADASNIPFVEGDYQIKASDVAGNSTTLDFVMADASGEYRPSIDGIDIVKGSTGDDYIYGGNGADILIANGGSDRLYGEAGNDTLIFGENLSGFNLLSGDAGDDTYIIDANNLNSSLVAISDSQGVNRLDLKGIDPSDVILTRNDSGVELLIAGGTISIFGQLESSGVENIYFDDGTVWDKATIEEMVASKVFGTDNDDVLTLDSENSVLYGLDGNDTLKGGVNDDYIYGGNGADILIANGGSDRLYGEAGNDTLIVGENSTGLNVLYGGEGDDTYIVEAKDFTNDATVLILDSAGSNRLELKGFAPSDVTLTRSDSSIELSTAGGKISLGNQFSGGAIDNIYFDDGTVWDKMTIEEMVNTGGSNARSMMSFDEAEDSSDDDSGNDYFSESIDLGNDTETYYDNNAALAFNGVDSNIQMSTLGESQQVELPNIDDLLDVNSNELVFEQAETTSTRPEISTLSDFTIGQVQVTYQDIQSEAILHIM